MSDAVGDSMSFSLRAVVAYQRSTALSAAQAEVDVPFKGCCISALPDHETVLP